MAKATKTHYRRMIGKAILVVFPLLIVLSIARGYILMLIQAAIDNDDVHRFNQLMDLGISPNSLVLDANDEHVDDSEAVMRYLLSPFSRGYIARESLLRFAIDEYELHGAKDLRMVKELLKRGANPNADSGDPALHDITFFLRPVYFKDGIVPDVNLVKVLLDAGADPSVDGGVLLARAAERHSPEIVGLLLDRGVHIGPYDELAVALTDAVQKLDGNSAAIAIDRGASFLDPPSAISWVDTVGAATKPAIDARIPVLQFIKQVRYRKVEWEKVH